MSRPTINDVAQRANVSKSLVSLVMREAPNVSATKRAAVLKAADDLGYRPNAAARSLVRRQSNVFGVTIDDLRNPFFAEAVDGVEHAAAAAGYRVVMMSGRGSATREKTALDALIELQVDAVILSGSLLRIGDIAAAAKEVPVVLLSRPTRSRSINTVVTDDERGAELAIDHLVSLGHRKIAHIDGAAGAGAQQRSRGYLRAMKARGLSEFATVAKGGFTEHGGATGVRALIEEGVLPTAIFVANDLAAIGAMAALDTAGLAVPEDVSIIGYDNTYIAGLRRLGLTTINQPRYEMGIEATRIALEHLASPDRKTEQVVLEPELVVRQTTRRVRRGEA